MAHLPSLTCLESFDCVARHGSISRAAAELNLTQSAVSRQILQLEQLLDVPLFERVRQRVIITDAGKIYLKDISRIMIDLKGSTSKIMACGGSASVLNLAVLPTFATQWLVPRLPSFVQKNPEITLNLSTRTSQFDFEAEPFDAAIHYGTASWPGAVTRHLMDEHTVAVCSPKFQVANRIRKPADLVGATLLHQSTRAAAWADWFAEVGVDNSHPLRGPRFEQFAMISQAAVYGLGVALLPKLLIEGELEAGRLTILFSYSARSANSYYVAVPEGRSSTPTVTAFTQWILQASSSTSPGGLIPKMHKPSTKYRC
jgi:LysR family transcriptional regulator, glycine cleavage system transcriptional activator